MAKEKVSFEQAMERLEEIVALLESGSEPLDSSMKLFEEGTKLAEFCRKTLEKAEQKVTMLTEAGKEEEHENG